MRQGCCTVKIRLKKKNSVRRKIMTGSQTNSLKAGTASGLLLYVIKNQAYFIVVFEDFPLHFRLCGGKNYSLKNFLVFCFSLIEVGQGSKKECWTVSKKGLAPSRILPWTRYEIVTGSLSHNFPQPCGVEELLDL